MNRIRDPIDRSLEALPPESASAGFTARVMEQIEGGAAERPRLGSAWRTWTVAAAAAVAIALLVSFMGVNPPGNDARANRSTQLAEMRRQHALLKQELGHLRRRAQDAAPVIYLGSVDEIDYVWDLSPLLERQAGRMVPAINREVPPPQFAKEFQ